MFSSRHLMPSIHNWISYNLMITHLMSSLHLLSSLNLMPFLNNRLSWIQWLRIWCHPFICCLPFIAFHNRLFYNLLISCNWYLLAYDTSSLIFSHICCLPKFAAFDILYACIGTAKRRCCCEDILLAHFDFFKWLP